MSTITQIEDVYASLGLNKNSKPEKPSNELGQEEFLKLMTTQLQNQDPFQPMENGDFIAQMAQFGTVSGIQELQNSVETMTQSMLSNQVTQATSLVGRQVLVGSDLNQLEKVTNEDGSLSGRLKGAVELPNAVSNLSVNVYYPSGELAQRINLGEQPGGIVDFEWDGELLDGGQAPEGSYRFTAEANVGGETQAFETYANVPVESVTFGRSNKDLELQVPGLGVVSMNDIKRIMN